MTISYHGKYFSGWQIQNDAITVQGELQKALSSLLKENIILTGSGRTDAGVHAIKQTANFKTSNKTLPLKAFVQGINPKLPLGVRILEAEETYPEFNARKSALSKTYRYQIYNAPIISPLIEDFYAHIKYKIDYEKMVSASEYFLGEHDFLGFTASKNSTKTTVRKIFDIKWEKDKNSIYFEVTGNGFLMKMVRNMVGTLLEIGAAKKEMELINIIFQNKDRKLAGATAPAKGLFLKEVKYG